MCEEEECMALLASIEHTICRVAIIELPSAMGVKSRRTALLQQQQQA